MGTPIGTPPNAIALKYLNDVNALTQELVWRLVTIYDASNHRAFIDRLVSS